MVISARLRARTLWQWPWDASMYAKKGAGPLGLVPVIFSFSFLTCQQPTLRVVKTNCAYRMSPTRSFVAFVSGGLRADTRCFTWLRETPEHHGAYPRSKA